MKRNTIHMQHLRIYLFVLLSFLAISKEVKAAGGFFINETFRGKSSNAITLGGEPKAILTASTSIDAEGEGWLRLTRDTLNQKGYAIINKAFSSENGVLIDMEFNIWREHGGSAAGADGFSIFLYNAAVPSSSFKMGGFGGSLGYAQRQILSSTLEPGLTGGYVGIGFDEYGNFSTFTEARKGGFSNLKSNTIVIRGPEMLNVPDSNFFWLAGNSSLGFNLDAGQVSKGRPTATSYYRRTQLEIIKGVNNKYAITVRMMTQKNGVFTEVLKSVELPTTPPDSLKMGFAASTGAYFNIHEIRNLVITSAGGVRTSKTVDKLTAKVGDELTYTIDVYNQTNQAANGLTLNEQLALIAPYFKVTDVQFSPRAGNSASNYSNLADLSNISLNLAPLSYGTFTIKGNVKNYPSGGILTNTATVDLGASNIKNDSDLVNNTSSVSTKIQRPNAPDFVITQKVNQICLDSSTPNANVLTLKVTNQGESASVVGSLVTVKAIIPSGLAVTIIDKIGWLESKKDSLYTFTRSDVLAKDGSYQDITIALKQQGTKPNISFKTTAIVVCDSDYFKDNNSALPVTVYSEAIVRAGQDTTVYNSGIIRLAGNSPGALTGLWTVVSHTGPTTINSPSDSVTTVTLLPNNNATLRWTLSNSSCSSYDEVVVSYFVPKLTLVKTVSKDTLFKLGSEIKYTLTATNNGLVALKNVTLTDKRLTAAPILISGDTNKNNIMEGGEVWVYSGSYIVKQADVDSGMVRNSATITALDPQNNTVRDVSGTPTGTNPPNDNPTITPIEHINKVTLLKKVYTTSPYKLGDVIGYSFEIKNEGTTTFDSVRLIDNKLLSNLTNPLGGDSIGVKDNRKLDPKETWRYKGEYTVTAADVTFGKVSNLATVYCRDLSRLQISEISENNVPTVAYIDKGKIALVKEVDTTTHKPPFTLKNDTIDYKFTVTNIGDVVLDSIVVKDLKYALTPIKRTQGDSLLNLNESWIYKASYKVTQADVDAGMVINSALVTSTFGKDKYANDFSGTKQNTDDPTITNILQIKSDSLVKEITNSSSSFTIGSKIHYKLTAINTGTVTLNPPKVTDPTLDGGTVKYEGGDDFNPNRFDPGERWVHSGIHTVTLADLVKGSVSNVAYLSALDPQGFAIKDTSKTITTLIYQGPTALEDQETLSEGVSNVVVNIQNNDILPWVIDSVVITTNPKHGIASVTSDDKIKYTPTSGFTGTDTLYYKIRDEHGSWSNIAIVIFDVKSSALTIPNVFTPNGDGKNDYFHILGLGMFEYAKLVIYNRWGNEVYMNSNYKDDNNPTSGWRGNGLNDGTYYYLLTLQSGTSISRHTGWVLLKR